MFRCLILATIFSPLLATALQAPPGLPQKEAENVETLVKLQVDAMAPPRPALKYQLLPEFKELQPGNPIQGYARCFAEYNEFFYGKETAAHYEKWLELPIDDLPAEIRGYVDGGPLKRFDDASRLDRPYWNMMRELKRDGVATLLPDLQQLRHLAGWNRIRMRYAIKEKRFLDVIAHAKSGFQMARHMDENHTLIGDLVGVAIGTLTCQSMEEMLNQPGAPNLFWAWSHLPSPMISIRNGVRGENALVFADFGDLCDPKRVWGAEEIESLKEKLNVFPAYVDFTAAHVKTFTDWIESRLQDEKFLSQTRKECVEQGLPEDKVKRYPPEQLVFHALLHKFVIGRDEVMKYLLLPFAQVQDRLAGLNEKIPPNATIEELCGRFLIGTGLYKIKAAQSRLDQRIAMLRIAEALRWHAAEHDGQFPKHLNEFKEPLPDDPMTGKPFKYEYDGNVAHVRGTPPKGLEKIRGYSLHYEITIRK